MGDIAEHRGRVGGDCRSPPPSTPTGRSGAGAAAMAALALRAAGSGSHPARPAAASAITSRWRPSRRSTWRSHRGGPAHRAGATRRDGQQGGPVLDAMVWSAGEAQGLEHEDVDPPDVPDPEGLPNWTKLRPDDDRRAMPFWGNFDHDCCSTRPSCLRPARRRRPGAPGARPADGHLRRSLGRRRRGRHRARRGERPAAPARHVRRTALDRTEPGPLRLVRIPRRHDGLALPMPILRWPRRAVVLDRQGVAGSAD